MSPSHSHHVLGVEVAGPTPPQVGLGRGQSASRQVARIINSCLSGSDAACGKEIPTLRPRDTREVDLGGPPSVAAPPSTVAP